MANVKKDTAFHWYKEDDEVVPETAPNVMSGSCALPLPLVNTMNINLLKFLKGNYAAADGYKSVCVLCSSRGKIRAFTKPC